MHDLSCNVNKLNLVFFNMFSISLHNYLILSCLNFLIKKKVTGVVLQKKKKVTGRMCRAREPFHSTGSFFFVTFNDFFSF